ncbi:SAM-dependent methyltransferase [Streptomyces sp. H27-H1]|uniref:THUMP-like domain-containing protein n=1 Tax=Streptomyces sp. H27-H1 TaxID=2996461 RepID=UPI00226E2FA1|nr:SAM-dependent methyltransferase [Streptomyces sp. H27-H1]MCY0926861.1 SAM-dependent methyltransferase [Streptomyces sp. H27-H1]
MDLETFRALLTDEGQDLLAALQAADPAELPATVTGQLRYHPAALVSAAVEQVRLRRRAPAKFGEYAAGLYFTEDSLELSSHLAVSEYKLGRVLDELGVVIIDAMGLGSGADALVLGWSHHTLAVDGDPLTVEIAAANRDGLLRPMFHPTCADVMEYDVEGEAVFIDLMRRAGPGGVHDPEAYDPPLSWALDRVRATKSGWIRLAPDLSSDTVTDLGGAHEAEWISYHGQLQEMVAWFGLDLGRTPPLAPEHRATLLPGGASLTGRGLPEPAVRPAGRYLYAPDPAVVRAGLVAEVAQDITGGLLDGGGPLLTADELRHTPFATAYEITAVLPFTGTAPEATLREHALRRVTVATQGSGREPDAFRHGLGPEDPETATAFITGTAECPTVLVVSSVPVTRAL